MPSRSRRLRNGHSTLLCLALSSRVRRLACPLPALLKNVRNFPDVIPATGVTTWCLGAERLPEEGLGGGGHVEDALAAAIASVGRRENARLHEALQHSIEFTRAPVGGISRAGPQAFRSHCAPHQRAHEGKIKCQSALAVMLFIFQTLHITDKVKLVCHILNPTRMLSAGTVENLYLIGP